MIRYEVVTNFSQKTSIAKTECKVWYPDSLATQKKHRYAPGKILAFFCQQPLLDGNNEDINNSIVAIMHTCNFTHSKSSMFSTKWTSSFTYDGTKKKKYFEMIYISSIIRQCLMIPNDSKCNEYHEIWDTSLWADSFLRD